MTSSARVPVRSLFSDHPRSFHANRYVYPVVSRRSRGISIGVNLSPDRQCNFHCVYCQVDRSAAGENQPLDPERLADELDHVIELVVTGRLFESPAFQNTPGPLRRLNDIALSGDGEPTACADFARAVTVCAAARRRRALADVKLVLITNGSLLLDDAVRGGLAVLYDNNGEIWAKLDAGTEEYYGRVNRSGVPFASILDNLTETARRWPLVVQTLFMRLNGRPPSDDELSAYVRRLRGIVDAGGRIDRVQIHTVARPPAESWVAPLADDLIDAIGDRVRRETGLVVETFHA